MTADRWRKLSIKESHVQRAVTFTIRGAPRTKKNHGRVIQRGHRRFHVPSTAHQAWFGRAIVQVVEWVLRTGHRRITSPVNVCALFYRETLAGDTCGYYQALADLLERSGILENDRLIASWDGSRLFKDATNPRIELQINPSDA